MDITPPRPYRHQRALSPFGSLLNIIGIKSSDDSALTILKFGNYTANFDKVPPPIPPEYLFPLYGMTEN